MSRDDPTYCTITFSRACCTGKMHALSLELHLDHEYPPRVIGRLTATLPTVHLVADHLVFTGFHLAAFVDALARCHETMAGAAEFVTCDESARLRVAAKANHPGYFDAGFCMRHADWDFHPRASGVRTAFSSEGVTFDQSYLPAVRAEILEFIRINQVDTQNAWAIPD